MKINIKNNSIRKNIIYVLTIILSILFILIGNKIATADLALFESGYEKPIKVRVEQVTDKNQSSYSLGGESDIQQKRITFSAKILDGKDKGQIINAVQSIDGFVAGSDKIKEVKSGDTVMVFYSDATSQGWLFMEYVRTDILLILGIVFVGCLLIFGRKKGVNTILSLMFTCAAIFAVYIPSILSGQNIYMSSIIICIYVIIMTLLIVNGADKKSLCAMIGCFGGIIISALLTIIMSSILHLTGVVSEESVYLTLLKTDRPIDLNAVVFGAIIVGALGAIMDVSMSISSSLWELRESVDNISFKALMKSGISIGRDIMGTMANTLILAYIGSSLSLVLILSAYNNSLLGLLNREMVVVEILQALVGSFGILLAMPLTSAVCSFAYVKRKKKQLNDTVDVPL